MTCQAMPCTRTHVPPPPGAAAPAAAPQVRGSVFFNNTNSSRSGAPAVSNGSAIYVMPRGIVSEISDTVFKQNGYWCVRLLCSSSSSISSSNSSSARSPPPHHLRGALVQAGAPWPHVCVGT